MGSFELILQHGSGDSSFAVENCAKSRCLPQNPVSDHYRTKSTAQPKVLSVLSLTLVCGWTVMGSFEWNLQVRSKDGVFCPKIWPKSDAQPLGGLEMSKLREASQDPHIEA